MTDQPHLDSRDVRFFHPADPGSPPTIADLRQIQRVAWETGHATGEEAGKLAERDRIERILLRYTGPHARVSAVLTAIRSGEEPTK